MPWACRLRPPPAKEKVDPPGLRDKVAALFDEWAHLSEDQPAEKVHAKFVEHPVSLNGLLGALAAA